MMQIEIGLRMVDNDTAVLLNSSVSFTPMEVRSVLQTSQCTVHQWRTEQGARGYYPRDLVIPLRFDTLKILVSNVHKTVFHSYQDSQPDKNNLRIECALSKLVNEAHREL